jgi:hypothetical protein
MISWPMWSLSSCHWPQTMAAESRLIPTSMAIAMTGSSGLITGLPSQASHS